MDIITAAIENFKELIWGIPMIVILLGTHLFMTFKTGFIQKKVFTGIRLSVTKDTSSEGEVSQFGALTTALASTIGTGNIVGVGTAIALGGPGAVFWCWITGVFGIATKYSESLIAVKYRVKTPDGRMQGGAMYALERALNMKWLGILFALFAAFASFGIGCGAQINSIATIVTENVTFIDIPAWTIGVFFGIITILVIFGGVKSIAKVCEALVPFMAAFYVIGCLIILGFNFEYLGDAVKLIMTEAFSIGSVGGGLAGRGIMMAAQFGISRGLFSNESGMGSAPLVAAAAKTKNPVRQALVSSTGTFWDTVVVCLMTGLVLVSTYVNPNMSFSESAMADGARLTTEAFNQIPYVGSAILVIGIICFAYSTILGWSYYGERCMEYIAGKKSIIPYKIVFITVLVVSPLLKIDLVWTLADILNAFMAVPNLTAVILLSGTIAKDTRHYLKNLDEEDKTEIPVVDA